MNVIDIIILACLVPATIRGVFKGFISQAAALVSLVLGVWLSFKFSVPLGNWIKEYLDIDGTLLHVISFICILTGVIICLNLLSKMVEGLFKIILLGWVNKLAGGIFAMLKGVLLLGLAASLATTLNASLEFIPSKLFEESILYKPLTDISDLVFPYLKELIFNK